jgi:hypothetical protein
MKTGAITLSVFVLGVGVVGCGGQPADKRAEADARSLVSTVVSAARDRDFAKICRRDVADVVRQLLYLVGGRCSQDMADTWAEGVQLTNVGRNTRVLITGNAATILDGPTPDRAARVEGAWRLSEMPRNRRFATDEEARKTVETLNRVLRAEHKPTIEPETGRLGPHGPVPPE